MNINLNNLRHIHFIGIKGVAMTALAIAAKEMGKKVTGSDVDEEFITDTVLEGAGIQWQTGFSARNLSKSIDLVVATGAHGGMTNPEATAAKKMGLKVLMHARALAEFMKLKKIGIAVAGSHGKGTTASMIAYLLSKAGLKPAYAVGTVEIFGLGAAGHWDKGDYFVVEADEYMTCPETDPTPRFLYLRPQIAVVTNVDFDHPDAFADLQSITSAFNKFKKLVPNDGWVIEGRKVTIDKKIKLLIAGQHNQTNASLALTVGEIVGIDKNKGREILAHFQGTKRRFEFMGKSISGALVYDDYAHHPAEIKATLGAARHQWPLKKITVVFQPHTYSRTKALFGDFSQSFKLADRVIITKIFSSAREKPIKNVSGKKLSKAINNYSHNCHYIDSLADVVEYLSSQLGNGDLLITMGAGDVYKIGEKLLKDI